MKKLDDICVLVQARLGSQRVPQKMIRPFAGTTLMDICLEKLSASSYIPSENIVSSVYEPELVEISERYPIQIFNRSEQSANILDSIRYLVKFLCHKLLEKQGCFFVLLVLPFPVNLAGFDILDYLK